MKYAIEQTRNGMCRRATGRLFFSAIIPILLLLFSSFIPRHMASETSEWVLDKTVGQVDCFYRFEQCNGEKVVFLKFHNRNAYTINISWGEEFTTDQQTAKRKKNATASSLTLQPGEIVFAGCHETANRALFVRPGDLNPTYLPSVSTFSFSQVNVTRVNQ